MTKPKTPEKRGPKPETVEIQGNWEDAIKTALAKERPPEGWPQPTKKRRKKSKP